MLIAVTGRHVDQVTWRPAVIENDLPEPLSGASAQSARAAWNAARSCMNVSATPGPSVATVASETSPAPAAAVAQLPVES